MAETEVAPMARLLGKADRVLDHIAKPHIAALINSISEPGAANEGLGIASRSHLDGGELFDDLSPSGHRPVCLYTAMALGST